jgi:hypothetical protein
VRLTAEGSNIGVLQTTVAELVTVKEHQRKPSTLCQLTPAEANLGLSYSARLHHYALCVVLRVRPSFWNTRGLR